MSVAFSSSSAEHVPGHRACAYAGYDAELAPAAAHHLLASLPFSDTMGTTDFLWSETILRYTLYDIRGRMAPMPVWPPIMYPKGRNRLNKHRPRALQSPLVADSLPITWQPDGELLGGQSPARSEFRPRE